MEEQFFTAPGGGGLSANFFICRRWPNFEVQKSVYHIFSLFLNIKHTSENLQNFGRLRFTVLYCTCSGTVQ